MCGAATQGRLLVEHEPSGGILLARMFSPVGLEQEIEGLGHQFTNRRFPCGSEALERGRFIMPEKSRDLLLLAARRSAAERQWDASFRFGNSESERCRGSSVEETRQDFHYLKT